MGGLPSGQGPGRRLAEEYAIPFFLAMLLDIRGLTQPEDIQAVLGGEAPLSDPFQMKGMDQAVERIRQAIEGFERIAVYGDYDADGVTATAMLYTYLEAVGADVLYYIPQREGEGYGMNRHAVEILHQEGGKAHHHRGQRYLLPGGGGPGPGAGHGRGDHRPPPPPREPA